MSKIIILCGFFFLVFSLNAYTTISGDMSGETLAAGTYFVDDHIFVNAGTTLTIDPGAILKFATGKRLYVEGTLNAIGLSTTYIVFTSQNDDIVGETIVGSTGNPDYGDWGCIYFDGNSSSEGICEMERCNVKYGGNTWNANIQIKDSNSGFVRYSFIRTSSSHGFIINYSDPEISNNLIALNQSDGVFIGGDSNPIISSNNISDNQSDGISITMDSAPSIISNYIESNFEYGVYVSQSTNLPQITNNNINDNGLNPIYCYANQIGNITSNSYSNNGEQKIKVYGTTISEDATWEDPGIPYSVNSSAHIYVQGTDGADNVTTLTIEPGTEIQFDSVYLYIGHDSSSAYPGKLIANGTETNPITFTSNEPSPSAGDWYGIYFADYADDNSELSYCTIKYGGITASYDNIYLNGCSPTISNCEISYADGNGIYCNNSNPQISNCNIHDNSSIGIYCNDSSPDITNCTLSSHGTFGIQLATKSSLATITGNSINSSGNAPIKCYARHIENLSGNTYSGNGLQMIYALGDTISTDTIWEDHGIPILIEGDTYVIGTDGAETVTQLTIQENVELYFATDTGLYIGGSNSSEPGALWAVGSAGNEILFSGYNQTAGSWDGIKFDDGSNSSQCKLSYCNLEYGGFSDTNLNREMIDCNDSPSEITYCNISYSNNSGIGCSSSNTIISNCTLTNMNYYGINLLNSDNSTTVSNCIINICNIGIGIIGNPTISDCVISNNSQYGIECRSDLGYPVITNNQINLNGSHPISCYAGIVSGISNNTYSGNAVSSIEVIGSPISNDATWVDQGIPYYVTSSNHIYVQGTDGDDNLTTLTIEPGAEIQFNSNHLYVGHSSNSLYSGKLIAIGTEENKITFTSGSSTPYAGDWMGIYFFDYADDSSELSNCIIEYAGASTYSGVSIMSSSPTISECEIYESGHSGIHTIQSYSSISNCEIYDCDQRGIDAENSNLDISNCLIFDNDMGIFNHISSGYLLITNCTLYGNNYGFSGSSGTSATILNSIIWNSTTSQIYIGAGYNLDIGYCDIQNAWSGTGNINSDPEFVDPLLDNYELAYNSPCIDTGAPSSPLDLDGTRADMGYKYFDRSIGVPTIDQIADVPDDQGRQVQIVWNASSYDENGSLVPVAQYSVWRNDEIFPTDDTLIFDDMELLFEQVKNAKSSKPLYLNTDEAILTYINTVPAMGFSQYSLIAPTLQDSSSAGTNNSEFTVYAHTDVTLIYFASESAFGYSVDNIPPCETTVYVLKENDNFKLSWDEIENGILEGNLYPELNGIWYKIYAGNEPEFVCDEQHLVETVTDLQYDYPINSVDSKKFFKVIVSDNP
ncbi:MAG: right-handed parallel beta-helix repeat-containing protein [Candidatus Cloacimonetes bacterium]|nr:right-handed parallel beta-helix repeat-containing protein [Candidatus Cloacimonadota bacterium]MCF7814174.1 right-handed parallel beta-helix repeat-containing protein [Candidatus Cloacimonadota bacterium]MCF7868763.1 right-handed parallel beta-helix repeat-containing protein [Candidatus Cloacimonadota bacterium]MCF7884166.1 right-handed parallel beta-helix repeat-containing protein [Candidatus Cloacimonadota bacterium]